MSAGEPTPTLEDVETTLGVTEGRVAIGVEDEPATVRLTTPDYEPLSRVQRVASLTLTGDGFHAALRLDAAGVDALVDALLSIQEGER